MEKERIKNRLEERTHSLASILNEIVWVSFEETLKDLRGETIEPLMEKMDDPEERDYWDLLKQEVKRRLEDLLNVI
jgi:hypothetical protein